MLFWMLLSTVAARVGVFFSEHLTSEFFSRCSVTGALQTPPRRQNTGANYGRLGLLLGFLASSVNVS